NGGARLQVLGELPTVTADEPEVRAAAEQVVVRGHDGTLSDVGVGAMRMLCPATVAGLALLGSASAYAATPSLYFHYAANCTFSIVDDSGSPVTTIAPGTYQVVVDSPFAFSSETGGCSYVLFQLTGPGGVSVTTTLGTGDSEIELFTVTLLPSSTYVAIDNNN